ncbi:hypothetical protein J6590_107306, partial [Homalodisca vitripennis]
IHISRSSRIPGVSRVCKHPAFGSFPSLRFSASASYRPLDTTGIKKILAPRGNQILAPGNLLITGNPWLLEVTDPVIS